MLVQRRDAYATSLARPSPRALHGVKAVYAASWLRASQAGRVPPMARPPHVAGARGYARARQAACPTGYVRPRIGTPQAPHSQAACASVYASYLRSRPRAPLATHVLRKLRPRPTLPTLRAPLGLSDVLSRLRARKAALAPASFVRHRQAARAPRLVRFQATRSASELRPKASARLIARVFRYQGPRLRGPQATGAPRRARPATRAPQAAYAPG